MGGALIAQGRRDMKIARNILPVLVMAWAAGCTVGARAAQSDPSADMAVPPHKPPPPNGSGTASSCDGITEKGRCDLIGDSELAETCDLSGGAVHKIDCTALGKHCVLDAHRGAACGDLPPPTPPAAGPTDGGAPGGPPPPAPPGTPPKPPATPDPGAGPDMSTTDPCTHGVTFAGYCSGTTAIWCDPSTGQIITWNCAQDSYSCQQDGCADGAYCCGDAPMTPMVDMAAPANVSAQCSALGYAGACQGNLASWCDNGTIFSIDCEARGQACAVDSCASGAWCCDVTPSATPDLATGP
jgi:hypothetical protein